MELYYLYCCTVNLDVNVYVHHLIHLFISPREHKNLLKIHNKCFYMFRSMTIIRELVHELS